jgi:3-oxoacyl-[acyl-carrier-protein] synthase-1
MDPDETLVNVVGTGARTAIGMTAPASVAAVRAAISGFDAHAFMIDSAGKSMVVAMAPYLSSDLVGVNRLSELAGPAVLEALKPTGTLIGKGSLIKVFVGAPPIRPGRTNDLGVLINRVVDEVSATRFRVDKITLIENGHAAGAMAIQAAWELVHSGKSEFALAGGVDSYLVPETLEWLEANDQLHSAGPENNAYGFIPGEAGCFVLLANKRISRLIKSVFSTRLKKVVTTQETKLIKTDAICLGEGLSNLFRSLSFMPSSPPADHLYCDMNGEPYRADEFGFAAIKAGELFSDSTGFTAPADCWGDVGAASGPLFLSMADAAIRKRYAPGPVLAAYTSSESGERCGFLVSDNNYGEEG